MKARAKAPVLAAGAGALLLALAGCTSATDAAARDASATTTATSDAAAACVAAVTPAVQKAMEPTPLVAPTAPLDLTALAGKSVWYITNSQNQFSAEMSTGVEEAGKAAGVDITVFDGQNSTARYSEGINQAVAQGAHGIILMAIQPSVVSQDVAKAAAAGVKVLSVFNSAPDAPAEAGTVGNLSADFEADGRLMADWALYDSGCSAQAVAIQSSPVKTWDLATKGITSAFAEKCPSDCKVTVIDLDPATIATDTTSKLQTALQVDPSVSYVLPVWDSAMPFITPAVAAAGRPVKVLAHDGISASLEMIAAGRDQQGTVAMPPPGWIGWAAFDEVARSITGAEFPGYVIPTRLVTKDNVGDGSTASVSPEFADYQGAFTAAWGK